MDKLKSFFRCVACATFLLSMLYSSESLSANVWSGLHSITSIYPEGGGFTFFLDGPQINVGGTCEVNRMQILATASNYETITSSLITAFAGSFIVRVNYDDTTITACSTQINRAIIQRN